MPRTRKVLPDDEEYTITVKQEPRVKAESVDSTIKEEPGTSRRGRKRKLSFEYVNLDADEADMDLQRGLAMDEDDEDIDTNEAQTLAKKSNYSRYTRTCMKYKSELKALPDPRGAARDVPASAYQQSLDLITFMKLEFEHEHGEAVKVKRGRRDANAKVREAKKEVTEIKGRIKVADTKAELLQQQVKDLNLELTSKLARPLSHAQIKLENVHEDYATTIADLRTQLMLEQAAKDTAEAVVHDIKTRNEHLESRFLDETSARELVEQDLVSARSKISELEEERDMAQRAAQEAITAKAQVDVAVREPLPTTSETSGVADAAFVAENARLKVENDQLKGANEKLKQELQIKDGTIQALFQGFRGSSSTPARG